MTLIMELEDWNNAEKDRCVSIEIDNGYGATCWTVHLYGKGKHLCCSETNFIEYPGRKGKDWGPEDDVKLVEHSHGYPEEYLSVVVDGDEMEDWPGLALTIKRALARANEIGM